MDGVCALVVVAGFVAALLVLEAAGAGVVVAGLAEASV